MPRQSPQSKGAAESGRFPASLCECGRELDDCALVEGATYHADRDEYLLFDEPATYRDFERVAYRTADDGQEEEEAE